MNISPSKLAAATAIVSRQSVISPFTGPFVDMFQVPQGKVGILIAGGITSPDPGGLASKVVTIGLCDNSFSYGSGPVLGSTSGKVDPQSLGVAIQDFSLFAGTQIPFTDSFGFSAHPIAIGAGWFLRAAVADDAAPPASGIFIVNLIAALIDECDC